MQRAAQKANSHMRVVTFEDDNMYKELWGTSFYQTAPSEQSCEEMQVDGLLEEDAKDEAGESHANEAKIEERGKKKAKVQYLEEYIKMAKAKGEKLQRRRNG